MNFIFPIILFFFFLSQLTQNVAGASGKRPQVPPKLPSTAIVSSIATPEAIFSIFPPPKAIVSLTPSPEENNSSLKPSVEESSPNVGAIIGGVVGAIAVLVLIALLARVVTRGPMEQGPEDIDFQETTGGGPSYIDAAVEGRISAIREQEGNFR